MPKTWTAQEVERIMLIDQGVASLNEHVVSDGEDLETELGDLLEDPDADLENQFMKNVQREYIVDVLTTVLSAREREIIFKRFGFFSNSMTLEEIGYEMHITRERVRQIEAKAIKKLQRYFQRKKLTEEDI